MFCNSCGGSVSPTDNFCPQCGSRLRRRTESLTEGASGRPMTYDEFATFRRAKEHERQGHFRNAGGRRKKMTVSLQIGRMHECNCQLRKVRGSVVMLTVNPDITADELLPLAVEKHCACNWHLPKHAAYKLLYPDGQVVRHIPGTSEVFTLEKYKSFLGKSYAKVILFICEEDDYSSTTCEISDDTSDEPSLAMECRESPSSPASASPETSHSLSRQQATHSTSQPAEQTANTDTAEHILPSQSPPEEPTVQVTEHSVVQAATPSGEVVLHRGRERPLFINHQQCAANRMNDCVIDESDDEELQAAIQTSITESQGSQVSTADALGIYKANFPVQSGDSVMIIRRSRTLNSAFEAMKRSTFSCFTNLKVEFSGEEAIDIGGPRREFFRLAIRALMHQSALFEGDRAKYMSYDVNLLTDGKYRLAGQLAAMSIRYDGPGPQCMHQAVYDTICDRDTAESLSIEDLQESEVKTMLHEISGVTTADEYDRLVNNYGSVFADMGISRVMISSIHEKNAIIKSVLKHLILYRCKATIDEFRSGLNDVGLLQHLLSMPQSFKPLFCCPPAPVTRATLRRLFTINWSASGSNLKEKEEDSIYAWEQLLLAIQDGDSRITFEQLLQFVSGADEIPILGFDTQPSLDFYTPVANVRRLPYASTCDIRLFLPRGVGVQELSSMLEESVLECSGFGFI